MQHCVYNYSRELLLKKKKKKFCQFSLLTDEENSEDYEPDGQCKFEPMSVENTLFTQPYG